MSSRRYLSCMDMGIARPKPERSKDALGLDEDDYELVAIRMRNGATVSEAISQHLGTAIVILDERRNK